MVAVSSPLQSVLKFIDSFSIPNYSDNFILIFSAFSCWSHLNLACKSSNKVLDEIKTLVISTLSK